MSVNDKLAFNQFLIVVGVETDKPFVLHARVTADMACDPPDPPITVAEMQSVCHAAKMALAKVLRARRKTRDRS